MKNNICIKIIAIILINSFVLINLCWASTGDFTAQSTTECLSPSVMLNNNMFLDAFNTKIENPESHFSKLKKEKESKYTPIYAAILHGVGKTKVGSLYYGPLKKRIKAYFNQEIKRLTGVMPPEDAINITPMYYSGETVQRVDDILEDVDKALKERHVFARGMVTRTMFFNIASTVFAYFLSKKKDEIYKPLQKYLDDMVADAREHGASKDNKAVLNIIGHSLGALVGGDKFYDLKKAGNLPDVFKIGNLDWLGGALHLKLGLDPTMQLDDPLRSDDKWGRQTNFFDPNDCISSMISVLSEALEREVLDYPINAGWKLNPFSATFMAHVMYWKTRLIAKIIARNYAHSWLRHNPEWVRKHSLKSIDTVKIKKKSLNDIVKASRSTKTKYMEKVEKLNKSGGPGYYFDKKIGKIDLYALDKNTGIWELGSIRQGNHTDNPNLVSQSI